MQTIRVLFQWSLLAVLMNAIWCEDEALLTTGRLLGSRGKIDGIGYRSFLGIPYAEPPVASRRFLPPVQKTPWTGVRDATRPSPKCPHLKMSPTIAGQYLYDGSEDCLTLDVFVPSPSLLGNSSNNGTRNATQDVDVTDLAVVVVISGSPEHQTAGEVMATRGGVVVVVVNYRVGLLGFLTTGNEDASGNIGLLDQQQALLWVQENIESFGGDPTRVTLLGDSLVGTTLHLYSPGSETLFQRIVAQSEAMTPASISSTESSKNAAFQLGVEVGCPSSNSSFLLKCLRSKTAMELIVASRSSALEAAASYPWIPLSNGVFFSTSNGRSMSSLDSNVDILLGFSSNEGPTVLPRRPSLLSVLGLQPDTGVSSSQFNELLSLYLDDVPIAANNSVIRSIVRHQYTDWTMPVDDTSRLISLLEIIGDVSVVLPGFDFIKDVFRMFMMDSIAPNIYFYVFDNTYALTKGLQFPLDLRLHQATFSTGVPFSNSSRQGFTEEERQLSADMMGYFTNFAKTGNPNGDESNETQAVPIRWPSYTKTDRHHIVFQIGNFTTGNHYKASDIAFWTVTLPQIEIPDRNFTCPNDTVPTNVTQPSKVVIGRRLGWKLTPEQAGIALQTLLALMVVFILLTLLLVILWCRTRAELQTSHDLSTNTPKRGAGTKKSIRGSSTTWLWRPRDPDEAVEVEFGTKEFDSKT